MELVSKVAKDVDKLGGKVFYVGGYVRDKFLHKVNKDIDVEVYGLTLDDLKKVLGKYGYISEVGASFGILMVKGYDVDFSLPRTENSTGNKHTDFEVNINHKLSVKDATRRRDFTINALLQDVLTTKYVDLYGGMQDIKQKVIRYVDEDTFKEDELRVFRACQFSARFDFGIDKGVYDVAQQFDYTSLSKERIFEELNKALLKSDKPSIAFNALYDMGVVEKLFPELYALKGCEQSQEHHPEGDVWNHTMMVLDQCARLRNKSSYPLGLMYTGLCHDMGKPNTKNVDEEGKITFYDHENVGVEVARVFLRRLTTDKKLLAYVKNLTKYHMKGHLLLEMRDFTVKQLFTKVDMAELLLFTEADELGRGGTKYSDFDTLREQYTNKVAKLSSGGFGVVEPYFNGSDLLAMGFTEGKVIGETLKEMYLKQLGGDSKDKLVRVLHKRINPRKKPKRLEELVDYEIDKLIREDKQVRANVAKRLEWFKVVNNKQERLKYRKSINGIPFAFVMAEDKKSKYLVTPVCIIHMSLDNRERVVLFSTTDTLIGDREKVFANFLNNIQKNRVDNFRYLSSVYGSLPNKI